MRLRRLLSISRTTDSLWWLYVLTFLVVLPFTAKDLVFSVYASSSQSSDALQNQILSENARAVKAAEEYLRATNYQNYKVPKQLQTAIVVVTVRRFINSNPLGYVTRVVTTIHKLLRDTSLHNQYLFVCNVHAGPGHHKEVDELRKHFPTVDRFPNGSAEAVIMNPFEKEKQDYVFCLEEALRLAPEFVLVVEDDALPRNELFPVLKHLTNYLQDRADQEGNHPKQFSYAKLYYPERWQGYSFEIKTMCELLALFAMGTTLMAIQQGSSLWQRSSLTCRKGTWVRLCFGGFYPVIFALAIGRQHLINFKRILAPYLYSLVTAPDCCSPCILYPSSSAAQVVHYLRTVKCSSFAPLDAALDSFTRLQPLPAYLVEPNVFRHIGFVSTIKGLSAHPEEFLI